MAPPASANVLFFSGGQHLLAGVAGGSGGDDPSYPIWSFKSSHEIDAIGAWRKKVIKHASTGAGAPSMSFPCPICERTFGTEKAVHGHMRKHTNRGWRGMEEPKPDLGILAADGKLYRYVCDWCKAPFMSRQALGGHRASHNGRKGCSFLSKHNFDLNELPPEAAHQEEDDEQ